MHQVLYYTPFKSNDLFPNGIPIYGYGFMLFVAFIACVWLAGRRAQRVGISKDVIWDLAIWLFVGGLLGSRVAYLLDPKHHHEWDGLGGFFLALPQIWKGGVVFYGGAIGGLIAYLLAYRFVFRKHKISSWKLADVVAPSIAVGLFFGRIGCLLNGCCYGQPAPTAWYALHFPRSAPVFHQQVADGLETLGFTLDERDRDRVGRVEAGSPAAAAGLQDGDAIENPAVLVEHQPGKNWISLSVKRGSETGPTALPPFKPLSLGVQPTQIYESISMVFLFLVLMAFHPFRRHDGEMVAVLMIGYGMHRYLNEILRGDPRPVDFEKYTSVFLIVAAIALFIWLRSKPAQYPVPAKEASRTT